MAEDGADVWPLVSIFDRAVLSVEADRPVGRRTDQPAQVIAYIEQAVCRDLQLLLNERQRWRGWPTDWSIPQDVRPIERGGNNRVESFAQLDKSLIDYGLADFGTMSLATDDQRAAVARHIQSVIERFEPRISLKRIAYTSPEKLGLRAHQRDIRHMHFNVEATLVVHATKRDLFMDTAFDRPSRSFDVSLKRSA